jgi:hypothetical protein
MKIGMYCLVAILGGSLAQRCLTADVVYELSTNSIDQPLNAREFMQPVELRVKDRVWSAPGIEESTKSLEPHQVFDFRTACQKSRIDDSDSAGPRWLDDVVWPRTRELWDQADCRTVAFVCGGIAVQR